MNTQQADQISEMRIRIEGMERERAQKLLDEDRMKSEFTLLNEKIRSLEDELRIKVVDFDAS